jgi:hypothetical protein
MSEEEKKPEGVMVIDMERSVVRVLDGQGKIDENIVKEFFARMRSEEEKGDIDTSKIETYLFEIRWPTEGRLIEEAHHFLKTCKLGHIVSVTSGMTDRIFFDWEKQ